MPESTTVPSGAPARRATHRVHSLACAVAAAAGGLAAFSCQRSAGPGSAGAPAAAPIQLAVTNPRELRSPEAFSTFQNPAERSQALFAEAARVFTHTRCLNCHPSADSPTQADGRAHDPPVLRGPEDRGVVGMECTSCHQTQNLEFARVPGAENWHLAPRSMGWAGQDPGAICEQLKDPQRNGNRTLDKVVEHAAHDSLVAWGWEPGSERETPPGTQAGFAALVSAWVETGAVCPPTAVKGNAQ
jgi:hypothetical protein